MTKPISRKMAVDALLYRMQGFARINPEEGGAFHILPCAECGEPLLPGQQIQFDHHHADGMGGPHEYQNLRPIHYDPCHKAKTARDVAAQAKVARITGKTKTRPRAKIQSPGFAKAHRPMRRKP